MISSSISATPPVVNYNATVAPPPVRRASGTNIVSAETVKKCAGFTAESARFLASPEYSLLITGFKLWMQPASGGWFSGLNQAIGILCLGASPVWGGVRIGVGVPTTVAGAAATTAAATAYVAEGAINMAVQGVQKAATPSEAARQREHLMQQFVNRMQEMLRSLAYNEQQFFKNNPKQLICQAIFRVAFLSRDLEARALRVGTDVLTQEQVSKQDNRRQGYFRGICEIKEAIRSLNLGLDSNHAWTTLMTGLEQLEAATPEIVEDDWVRLPNSEARDQYNRRETLVLLLMQAEQLSHTIASDELFKKAWRTT